MPYKKIEDTAQDVFFGRLKRTSLLTGEEEIELSWSIQLMQFLQNAKNLLIDKGLALNEIDDELTVLKLYECCPAKFIQQFNAMLSQSNSVKYWTGKGTRSKTKLVESNLRLVVAIVKKYPDSGVPFMDLIQEGSVGLNHAAELFDPTRGYKFSTYAYWWIRQAITRAIQESRSVRIPTHIHEAISKIRTAKKRFFQCNNRWPTREETVASLKWTAQKYDFICAQARRPISLNYKPRGLTDSNDNELQNLISDDRMQSPGDYVFEQQRREMLQTWIKKLTPQQQEVFCLRFGFDGGTGKRPTRTFSRTLEEIAEATGRSREATRGDLVKGLRRLRSSAARIQMAQFR